MTRIPFYSHGVYFNNNDWNNLHYLKRKCEKGQDEFISPSYYNSTTYVRKIKIVSFSILVLKKCH